MSAPRVLKPTLNGKVIHYHSDGTGRDNYITVNEGGLCSARTTTSGGFFGHLR